MRDLHSPPAYEALGDEPDLGFTRWRVYMHLVHCVCRTFYIPAPVSIVAIAAETGMRPRHVLRALVWLADRGYITPSTSTQMRSLQYHIEWASEAQWAAGYVSEPYAQDFPSPYLKRLGARAATARRRNRRMANGGCHNGADIRAKYDAQGGRCFYCGVELGDVYHVDHMVPLARGGRDSAANICCACPRCNLRKGAKTADEFRAILVRRSA